MPRWLLGCAGRGGPAGWAGRRVGAGQRLPWPTLSLPAAAPGCERACVHPPAPHAHTRCTNWPGPTPHPLHSHPPLWLPACLAPCRPHVPRAARGRVFSHLHLAALLTQSSTRPPPPPPPQDPTFRGRRVVTFHNQRDFIFFRHHRYIFEERQKKEKGKKEKVATVRARLQVGAVGCCWVLACLLGRWRRSAAGAGG